MIRKNLSYMQNLSLEDYHTIFVKICQVNPHQYLVAILPNLC